MPQHCLGISSLTTQVAVTNFRLGPTESHWTSTHFYMPFILFSAVCQLQVYSVLASEIFLHSLESNLLPQKASLLVHVSLMTRLLNTKLAGSVNSICQSLSDKMLQIKQRKVQWEYVLRVRKYLIFFLAREKHHFLFSQYLVPDLAFAQNVLKYDKLLYGNSRTYETLSNYNTQSVPRNF